MQNVACLAFLNFAFLAIKLNFNRMPFKLAKKVNGRTKRVLKLKKRVWEDVDVKGRSAENVLGEKIRELETRLRVLNNRYIIQSQMLADVRGIIYEFGQYWSKGVEQSDDGGLTPSQFGTVKESITTFMGTLFQHVSGVFPLDPAEEVPDDVIAFWEKNPSFEAWAKAGNQNANVQVGKSGVVVNDKTYKFDSPSYDYKFAKRGYLWTDPLGGPSKARSFDWN